MPEYLTTNLSQDGKKPIDVTYNEEIKSLLRDVMQNIGAAAALFKVNTTVEVHRNSGSTSDNDGKYVLAKITRVGMGGTYDVRYCDNNQEALRVPAKCIRSISDAPLDERHAERQS
jgi:hypothetical protein